MGMEGSRPLEALHRLIAGNKLYQMAHRNPAYIGKNRRKETAKGQKPYAVVLTCSDSRVVPEHIFSAGLGELFVVRTAGNVVGDFQLGSIEFAVDQLQVPLVLVMGHTQCGAVTAALAGPEYGYVECILEEIRLGLGGAETEEEAICNNILHSKRRILQSPMVQGLVEAGELVVLCGEYQMDTGGVVFYREG